MRALRYAPLAVAVVVSQVALFPQLRLLGVVPDLGLVVALGVAWYGGSEAGALFGFVVGASYDLFLTTPLGTTGLAYALCAWLVGLMPGTVARHSRLLVVGIGLLGGALSGAVAVVGAILAGADQFQDPAVVGVILRASLYDALLALPAFAVVRVVRGPASPRIL